MGAPEQNNAVIGYRELRRIVGVLGFCYPILLPAYCYLTDGCPALQPTVSAYYHTNAHDLFVGVLFSIAVFMLAYKGPEVGNPWDSRAGTAACVFALGVALFPTAIHQPSVSRWVGLVHVLAAAGLFITLALMSLLLFTRTNKGPSPGVQKIRRNRVYRICGGTILLCILIIGAYSLFGWATALPTILGLPVVYALETLSLLCFGFSWLIKGETRWTDGAARGLQGPSRGRSENG